MSIGKTGARFELKSCYSQDSALTTMYDNDVDKKLELRLFSFVYWWYLSIYMYLSIIG